MESAYLVDITNSFPINTLILIIKTLTYIYDGSRWSNINSPLSFLKSLIDFQVQKHNDT